MEQGATPEHHVMTATLMGTTLPITTTPTNINAIILNSQIPGVQRLASVSSTATSPPATIAPAGNQTSAVAGVGVTQAQLPIIASAGSLRLPPIVAVEGAIKPDISLCSRVLKSFSDQDQASSDLEVQSVMFPGKDKWFKCLK